MSFLGISDVGVDNALPSLVNQTCPETSNLLREDVNANVIGVSKNNDDHLWSEVVFPKAEKANFISAVSSLSRLHRSGDEKASGKELNFRRGAVIIGDRRPEIYCNLWHGASHLPKRRLQLTSGFFS